MKICIFNYDVNTDYLLTQINDNKNYELVGFVHNNHISGIRYASERGISPCYSDLSDIFYFTKPDIIYIYSADSANYDVALEALSNGCSVCISSPFFLSSGDIESLHDVASGKGLMLLIPHPYFFCLGVKELIDNARNGNLNKDNNIEIEVNRNLVASGLNDYSAPNKISDKYSHPGGIFHADVYYALFVLIEVIGSIEVFSVKEFSSGLLPQNLSDRIELKCKGQYGNGVINISLSNEPDLLKIKIGEKIIIKTTESGVFYNITKTFKNRLSALFEGYLKFDKQSSAGFPSNAYCHKSLSDYYSNARYWDLLEKVFNVSKRIWPNIKNKSLSFDNVIPAYTPAQLNSPLVLVTGASGALGSLLVNQFVVGNFRVRCLVRKLSRYNGNQKDRIEVFYGDIADIDSLDIAFSNVDYVVHAAADTVSSIVNESSTVKGTRNVVDLCKKYKVKKLIYISTCNVYGVADYKEGYCITEESPLEMHPERRGAYTHTKLLAELIVQDEINRKTINAVCLRPGTYFGEKSDYFTPLMGFSFANRLFITIGYQEQLLPLICSENIAPAIIEILKNDKCNGRTYNIINSDSITKRQYIDLFIKRLYPSAICVHIPISILRLLVSMQERIFMMAGMRPILSRYRLESSQNNVIYDSSAIYRELKWTPPFTVRETIKDILETKNKNEE